MCVCVCVMHAYAHAYARKREGGREGGRERERERETLSLKTSAQALERARDTTPQEQRQRKTDVHLKPEDRCSSHTAHTITATPDTPAFWGGKISGSLIARHAYVYTYAHVYTYIHSTRISMCVLV